MRTNLDLGYKTFFMLNSTELEIDHAHKWLNANKCSILTLISMIKTSDSVKLEISLFISSLVFKRS